jgi:hypothetical protein
MDHLDISKILRATDHCFDQVPRRSRDAMDEDAVIGLDC